MSLISTGRYYGECGRSKVSLKDRLHLLANAQLRVRFGEMGLFYNMNSSNFSVTLDNNAGVVSTLPIRGNMSLWLSGDRSVGMFDTTNPLVATTWRAYAGWLAESGTEHTTANICYLGVCTSLELGTNNEAVNPGSILANVNRNY